MKPSTYTPPKGSIAAIVVDYFRRNPTESINADDMFIKFGLSRVANIRMELLDAYTTNLLKRREVNGEYEYSAGKRLLAELAEPAPVKPARKYSQRKTAVVRVGSNPLHLAGFPEPLSVPIEDDVPNTSNRGGKRVCWLPLLGRLTKAGQSAALPVRCKATLSKSITQAHKQWDARFTTKVDAKAGTVRVWRVA